MQIERLAGIAAGANTNLSQGPEALMGKSGAISRAIQNGSGSSLITGGLGNVRRVNDANAAKAEKKDGAFEVLKEQNSILGEIKDALRRGLP